MPKRADAKTFCPERNAVCPRRVSIIKRLSSEPDFQPDFNEDDSLRPQFNGPLMYGALKEHSVVAGIIGCEDLTPEGECPVGERMDQSPVRRSVVDHLRMLSYKIMRVI